MLGNLVLGIAKVLIVVATISGFAAICALPVMLLWDWLMPTLFGLKTITLWQALGLLILCGMLFKSSSSSSKS